MTLTTIPNTQNTQSHTQNVKRLMGYLRKEESIKKRLSAERHRGKTTHNDDDTQHTKQQQQQQQ